MDRKPDPSSFDATGDAAALAPPSIGQILIDAGRIDAHAAARIAAAQQQHGLRFGDAGLRLKLLRPEDVRFALSRQFAYPVVAERSTALSPAVTCAFQPASALAEQMRSLRTRVLLAQRSGDATIASIAILSAGRQEGRSFIAANLAVTLAQAGERVLLVDADLRHPSQHRLFGCRARQGLSDVLRGSAGLDCAALVPGFEHLAVLTAGTEPPNPQELLGRHAWPALLRAASLEFDRLVIDTAAGEPYADAFLVSAHASASLLVARAGRTDARSLARLRAALADTPSQLIGSVLNAY